MAYRWKPSKAAKADFAAKMREIGSFCQEHDIRASLAGDSYYFQLNGKNYRVSNHSVVASNRGADTVYILAEKTRLIEIYNDLAAGLALDSRGRRTAC